MKILHLATSDINGGAARAAYRLHKGLKQKGAESQMFVRDKSSYDESVIRYSYPKGIKKIGFKLGKLKIENDFRLIRPKGYEAFSDDRSPLKTGFFEQIPDADIYHLHWTSGFVDLPSFFKKANKPVVWTLHDMFPFTGGCHYNSSCDNYLKYCQRCPQLGSTKEKDLSSEIWTRKNEAISRFNKELIISTDSLWLAIEAKKSSLFKDLSIDTIHYGIETDEFIPRDKMSCRKSLNIPSNSRVIVFGAPGIDNPRKGFSYLAKALKQLYKFHSDLFLLSFGSGPRFTDFEMPFLHLGHIDNNHLLSIIYNCADVFVIPSLQEAFGQTALEAMSCSIPVVGFDTGGIPDMVENGVTGYLAETGNVINLADEINRILELNENDYLKMAANCREKVLNGFTLAHQADNYIKVYQKLI